MADTANPHRRRRYPRITARQERTQRVEAIVSLLERQVIAESAAEAGMTMSAYVRARALAQPTHHRELVRAMQRLTTEIARIGNNINQLARWANASSGGLPQAQILDEIRFELKQAVADLRAEIAIERPRKKRRVNEDAR